MRFNRKILNFTSAWQVQALLVLTLLTTGCDLSLLHSGTRDDASALAQSGLATAQSVQTVYITLVSERRDVQKTEAFRSIQVTSPCSIAPLPSTDQQQFDKQRAELQKRVDLAQHMSDMYQAFSSLTAFRASSVRSNATALASDFSGLGPIPSTVATTLPPIVGGVVDVLVSLKQNSEIKDYAKAIAMAAQAMDQLFAADTPALKALADERREKVTTFGTELMKCGLVSLQPVMSDMAGAVGLSLKTDESSFANFQKNIIAVAALSPAQHITDTANAIDADSSALDSLVQAHTAFNAKQPFSFKTLDYLVVKATAAATKLKPSTSPTAMKS